MAMPPSDAPILDPDLLRPSGTLLATQIALGAAIEREAVQQTDLDATTLDLLVRLDLAPDQRLRAVELCGQLRKSPSHISRLIDRAEDAGLATRQPDPDDRRAKSVSITPAGRAAVADFAPRLHAVLDRSIHQALDTEEIDALVGYLRRIESAAQAAPLSHP